MSRQSAHRLNWLLFHNNNRSQLRQAHIHDLTNRSRIARPAAATHGSPSVRLTRPAKRNALNDALILALRDTFENLPASVRAAVLDGEGDALLRRPRPVRAEGARRRPGHAPLAHVARGARARAVRPGAGGRGAARRGGRRRPRAGQRLPHPRGRRAAPSTRLPEGSRGIFVGGGGSVRIPRLIGAARMTDMMLTGRVYNAEEGERVGFAQYLVADGARPRPRRSSSPAASRRTRR